MRMKEVMAFFKVSRESISNWLKDPNKNFPKPYLFGKKYIWKKFEIEEYAESLRKESTRKREK